jgi:hypothetical protein
MENKWQKNPKNSTVLRRDALTNEPVRVNYFPPYPQAGGS